MVGEILFSCKGNYKGVFNVQTIVFHLIHQILYVWLKYHYQRIKNVTNMLMYRREYVENARCYFFLHMWIIVGHESDWSVDILYLLRHHIPHQNGMLVFMHAFKSWFDSWSRNRLSKPDYRSSWYEYGQYYYNSNIICCCGNF